MNKEIDNLVKIISERIKTEAIKNELLNYNIQVNDTDSVLDVLNKIAQIINNKDDLIEVSKMLGGVYNLSKTMNIITELNQKEND